MTAPLGNIPLEARNLSSSPEDGKPSIMNPIDLGGGGGGGGGN